MAIDPIWCLLESDESNLIYCVLGRTFRLDKIWFIESLLETDWLNLNDCLPKQRINAVHINNTTRWNEVVGCSLLFAKHT